MFDRASWIRHDRHRNIDVARRVRDGMWKGMVAGAGGVAVMTLGEKLEQAVTKRPGTWEGDLILDTDRSAIGTLVERSSRFTMLLHLPPIEGHNSPRVKTGPPITGAGAGAVRNAIAHTIATLPAHTIATLPEALRRSLTWDQGIEMAQHVQLRVDTGLEIDFCDPRSPWQLATNENTNGLLRQYFPRGTDLARHSADELASCSLRSCGCARRPDW